MNQLDDFFKDKFREADAASERFPFREEYWHEALTLIEADERARRERFRRHFLKWLGFVLLAALAGWLFFSKKSALPPAAATATQERIALETSSVNAPTTVQAAPAQTPEFASESVENQDFKNRIENAPSVSESKFLTENQNRTKAETPTKEQATRSKSASQAADELVNSSRFRPPVVAVTPGATAGTGREEAIQTDAQTVISDLNPISNQNLNKTETAAENQSFFRREVVDALPSELKLLVLPSSDLFFEKNLVVAAAERKIEPAKTSRFRFGPAANLSYHLGSRSGESFGYALGINGLYKINERWAVSLEPRFRQRADVNPSVEFVGESGQKLYSFGYQEDNFQMSYGASWWLETPVMLHFQPRRFDFGLGLTPGFYLASRGKIHTQTRSSFQPEFVEAAPREVWTDLRDVRKQFFALSGSVGHEFGRGFQIGLRANYATQNLTTNPDDPTSNASKLWLDATFKWLLFSK